MISAINANSLEMRIEIQRRDRKYDKGTNMRRGWSEIRMEKLPCTTGIVVGWMSFLITKFLLSVFHVRSLSFPLHFPFLPLFSSFSPFSSTSLRLSTLVNGFIVIDSFGRKNWTNLYSPKETKRNTMKDILKIK